MTKHSILMLGAGLLLVGAGCASSNIQPASVEKTPVTQAPAQAPAEAPSTQILNTVTILPNTTTTPEALAPTSSPVPKPSEAKPLKPAAQQVPTPTPDVAPAPQTPTTDPTPVLKTFKVSGQNFSFSPSEIKVKKGDKVRIEFTNNSGFHDLVIDGIGVSTPQISSGQTATVEFMADKVGTFEYYCSVGSHRGMGMKGNFIVE